MLHAHKYSYRFNCSTYILRQCYWINWINFKCDCLYSMWLHHLSRRHQARAYTSNEEAVNSELWFIFSSTNFNAVQYLYKIPIICTIISYLSRSKCAFTFAKSFSILFFRHHFQNGKEFYLVVWPHPDSVSFKSLCNLVNLLWSSRSNGIQL